MMFESFDDNQLIKIFALISFISVILGLFVYFLLFPVNCSKTCEDKQTIGVDPIALEVGKTWNTLNAGTVELQIDSCNKATRISEFVWQVELKPC